MAVHASQTIHLNGDIAVDSFDSSDPFASTAGLYDPTKSKDQADVAAGFGFRNSLSEGNILLRGSLLTSTNADFEIGPIGSIGSSSWLNSGNTGIEPGHSWDDLVLNISDNNAPFTGGAFTPSSGVVDEEFYTYVLTGGNYQMSSLSMNSTKKLGVTGDATFYVTGSISITGNAFVRLLPGATLKLYVGGATPTTNESQVLIGGRGIINPGPASHFQFHALPSVTSVTFTQLEPLSGLIVAPNATVNLGNGDGAVREFSGSCLGREIVLADHLNIHFDEALLREGPMD